MATISGLTGIGGAATINQFKNALSQGGFRPNQFKVILNVPTGLNANAGDKSTIQFMVKAAQLPASTLETVNVSYRGRQVKFAGERTFQPWQCEVYTDTDFSIRGLFETWINYMQRPSNAGGTLDPAAYQTDMHVFALDRNETVLKSYKFVDAFPTEVGAIAVDWDTNNQVGMYNISFDYNYFETSLGATDAPLAFTT